MRHLLSSTPLKLSLVAGLACAVCAAPLTLVALSAGGALATGLWGLGALLVLAAFYLAWRRYFRAKAQGAASKGAPTECCGPSAPGAG